MWGGWGGGLSLVSFCGAGVEAAGLGRRGADGMGD